MGGRSSNRRSTANVKFQERPVARTKSPNVSVLHQVTIERPKSTARSYS